MGVRFECPRGHKLNVKAHLAGQRAICPECGARFIVPAASGGRVEEASGEPPLAGQTVVASQSAAASLPAGAPGDAPAWYVRPASGGQFGPATTDEFRQWVADGRVPRNAWVWRTGWADWKAGAEAVQTFAAEKSRTPPPVPQVAPTAAPAIVPTVVAHDWPPARNGASAAGRPVDAIYAARRRRRQMQQRLTVIMAVVAVALLGLFLIVPGG